MSRRLAALLACSAAMVGCVLTIDHAIWYSPVFFEPGLIGLWRTEWDADSTPARAVITSANRHTYAITYRDEREGTEGSFEARLGRFGGRLALEVWPAEARGDLPMQAQLAVRGRMLLFLDTLAAEIRLSGLDPDLVEPALQDGTLRLPYDIDSDHRTLLLGTTEELESELGPFVERGELLVELGTWRRVSDPPPDHATEVPCFEPSAWRDADRLFHRDPHWVGADGASSVDLGDGRILWLFGDTWIDPSGRGVRYTARMISNSLAIQTGTDPSTASIAFYWGRGSDGEPASFFPDRGAERLWLGNGIRVGDRLVLFLSRVISTNSGLGFDAVGWTAVMVENVDADPSAWRVRPLETPANPMGVLVGWAAVARLGEHVYAFGSQNPVKSHPIYAARWLVEEVQRGDLRHPEWWAGELLGWVPDSSSTPRWPIFENGQSELTIHWDQGAQQFIAVQTQGFGPADITMRVAPQLTGPWTAPRFVYRPPEYFRPDVMIYAGKAHPQLTGADLVLTYATNMFEFFEHRADTLIYYPRFVRLSRCR